MRIDTRPVQWIGAALILGWAGFVALGLPLIAEAFPNEAATEAGKPVTVGGVTITPSEGWSLPKDESAILLLRNGGAQVTAFPPAAAKGDPESILMPRVDPLRSDAEADWQIGEPQAFTTTSGAPGSYIVALTPTQFLTTYVIVQDGQAVQLIATGTDTDWTTLHDQIQDMVKTIEIPGGAS